MTKTRKRSTKSARASSGGRKRSGPPAILDQLEEIRASGGDGELRFGRGATLHVSSLDKLFFPDDDITKGDVMRYYTTVSPVLLPLIKDRPLVLKRYPDGIGGGSFFQQNVGRDVPKSVRTANVTTGEHERAARIIGGDLLTLLYTVQIGTIAVHAWQTRVQDTERADSTTIDLDPGPGVTFAQVIRLALHVGEEVAEVGLRAALKTSGSRGIHIALPLPPRTTFEDAALVAQRIAERVVERQPKLATLERGVEARPPGTIYVDAQQNAKGKSVVAAYSVREKPGATVSAPLEWPELRRTLHLDSFTVRTMPARLEKVGDIWGRSMKDRNTKRALNRALRDA
jgi:bifunctional non-homologous end joining protein LigD